MLYFRDSADGLYTAPGEEVPAWAAGLTQITQAEHAALVTPAPPTPEEVTVFKAYQADLIRGLNRVAETHATPSVKAEAIEALLWVRRDLQQFADALFAANVRGPAYVLTVQAHYNKRRELYTPIMKTAFEAAVAAP